MGLTVSMVRVMQSSSIGRLMKTEDSNTYTYTIATAHLVCIFILVFYLLPVVAYLSTWLSNLFRPSRETINYLFQHFDWIWSIVNRVEFLRDFLLKTLYKSTELYRLTI